MLHISGTEAGVVSSAKRSKFLRGYSGGWWSRISGQVVETGHRWSMLNRCGCHLPQTRAKTHAQQAAYNGDILRRRTPTIVSRLSIVVAGCSVMI